MAVLQTTLHTFLHLLLEAVPLFLLGAVLGAGLEAWLKPGWIERWIGSGHRSVAAAALAGALLPGCAMSTMPLAQSLRRRGAALGTLTAFIMIAPILSPHTVFLTATLVSVPMAIGRVVLSLLVTLALGALLNAMERRGRLAPAVNLTAVDLDKPGLECPSTVRDDECCAAAPTPNTSPWRRFLTKLGANLRSLTPYLVGGLLVAALISSTVPADTIHKYLRGGWTAYLFAALIAFPIYVCDGGEIPLTRALLAMGVGPGPAFCFMLASVGTCLPTMAMATRIIGWRATVIYVAAWLVLAVGGGLLMGMWL
jgi:uncharacterized membrane protein YraQ (UPF0718 family)